MRDCKTRHLCSFQGMALLTESQVILEVEERRRVTIERLS